MELVNFNQGTELVNKFLGSEKKKTILLDGKNPDCNRAVKKNVPKIDMEKIKAIIENIPALSMEEKHFYKTILDIRYEKILSISLKKLQKQEKKLEQKKQYYPKL